MTEDRMRELFREMRDEPLPADSLARVRIAVSQRTQRRATAWWWRATGAVAIAAGLFIAVLALRMPDVPPAPLVAAARHGSPLQGYVPPQPADPPVMRPTQRIERQGAQVVVRIETPDPNVVLLLVGDAE